MTIVILYSVSKVFVYHWKIWRLEYTHINVYWGNSMFKILYTVFFQLFMFWFGPGLVVSSPSSTEARRIMFCTGCPMLCFAVMAVRPVSNLLENDCLQKSSLVRSASLPLIFHVRRWKTMPLPLEDATIVAMGQTRTLLSVEQWANLY